MIALTLQARIYSDERHFLTFSVGHDAIFFSRIMLTDASAKQISA